jgi:leucyl-tRNA synthetase
MHRTIKKVTEDIEALHFNTAISAIMEYVNALYGHNGQFSIYNLQVLVLLMSPITPFVAEEMWTEVLGNQYSVHQQAWPVYDPKMVQNDEVTIVVQVNGRMRGQIVVQTSRSGRTSVREEHVVETQNLASVREEQIVIEGLAQKDERVAKYLSGQTIKKVIFVPGKLINFVI